ncbi:TetR/AcrR family transcriptional regulator [Acinetobacter sp. V91_7]|uniref:TetR/AcrR family transcriptional regulator n=1 Tax=unclassified Acinetobacter TaxID=196816 RepID=UPI00287D0853|nr:MULTISPECIES: TetR/AcrR family transcriptional regulator [unclassified Acinetobacter]MDS7932176.1 TetR/AcrR family transcriptional regulator [Acinetobacter sp. V91_4B]MDS7961574.1 TetR/AcrR family transcriptional regulator [Acinetobacter sp. V91_7]MDS8028024.1 TetR/AcrR family transcriptional regulator [Acinetobacter sp. V91_13]
MQHLDLPFRALRVLHSARYLFNNYGFHKVGVDRIIEAAKLPKATFYNYFHSKERLIEMSLTFQKDGLKQEVLSIIYVQKGLTVIEKLRKIYFLHADLEGLYHLLFKAIFEIEKLYPKAYQVVVEYRNWLISEIYRLLLTKNSEASKEDAHMFLFVVDGAMVQLLGENSVDDRDALLEYFLRNIAMD